MSTLLEAISKFLVETWRIFNSFLNSLYGLITGSRPPVEPSQPILRPLDGDHPDHDPLHVHFTRSVAEKPSAVPPKPKLERRPTSGRGLLSIPLNDLLDDSDSDDGDISVHSLASSSSFEVSQVVENQEKPEKVQKQGITFNDAADKVLSSDGETGAADATVREKKDASGVANQQRKRASILDDDTLPPNVQLKLGNFINDLPKVTPKEFEKTFDEIAAEFPRFKKIKSNQVYEIIERDMNEYKRLPMDAAAEKLMEALCSCPKSH